MSVTREKIFIILLLVFQVVFWFGIKLPYEGKDFVLWEGSRTIKPELGIVPDVPSEAMVKAFSLGDEQFFFRSAGYQIQNAGDSFGRATPLKDYDYSKLYQWWMIFDNIDPESNYMVSLVAYYYAATQNKKEQLPYVIKYLEQHADRDPTHKWWWYSQGVYRAKYDLDDMDWALRLANKMASLPRDIDAPIWVWQMPAFIHEEKGEYNAACRIILNVIKTHKNLSQGEMNFMFYFIKERIRALVDKHKEGGVKLDPECEAIIEQQERMDKQEGDENRTQSQ